MTYIIIQAKIMYIHWIQKYKCLFIDFYFFKNKCNDIIYRQTVQCIFLTTEIAEDKNKYS